MARPPLRELAARAGVSEATASRVLNGRLGVSDELRDRVRRAMVELGFGDVPEPARARRDVVGIVCGEFLNPVFATLVHHVSTELGRRELLAIVAVTDRSQMPEERCIAELVERQVDGVISIGGRHSEIDGDLSHYAELLTSGMPLVFVNGAHTGLPVPHITCDEEAGARTAVAHLAQLGHRRIGCVLGSTAYIPTQRFVRGYRRALHDAGLDEPDEAISHAAFTLEGGRAGATRLITQGITAMIAGNDLMALGALAAADALGTDIAVVGYDGTDMTAFTNPPLTTLRQPFEVMAQHVADAIVAEIAGVPTFRDSFVFHPQLVTRSSTPGLSPAVPARMN
ncbi:MAG: LacI family DNA-binding transcriptional regulator [Actinomycetota bacterium]